MKFFLAIALFAAVASARILPADINLTPVELSEVEEILAAIHSPSTDPTTAGMLEQMLFDLLGISPVVPVIVDEFEPIVVGPAIVDQFEPISVGPAIIDFPLPEGALAPTPEAAAPAPSTPLVQIIVNVKGQADAPSPVQVDQVGGPSPVVVVENPVKPTPVKPTPVQVVDVAEEPVMVVEQPSAIFPEPVLIGNLPEAIVVAPAIVGPETLN